MTVSSFVPFVFNLLIGGVLNNYFTLDMANETRAIVKESHVYLLFGVEIAKRIVNVHDISGKEHYRNESLNGPKKTTSELDSNKKYNQEDSELEKSKLKNTSSDVGFLNNSNDKTDCTKPVVVMLTIAAFLYLIYNPPAVLDNMINVIMRDCPEKAQLDEIRTSLSRCESQVKSTAETLTKCTLEKNELDSRFEQIRQLSREGEAKLAKAQSHLGTVEKRLSKANEEIIQIRESNENYQRELDSAIKDKDRVSKSLDEAQRSYGTCKNKNMDHEISNAALLTDIEKLKKQLEKC